MRHVLWIGGPPRSGKTTVATTLARRHGLRLYRSDTRTWVHRDRALAAGVEAARAWESLPPARRWDQPAGRLLALSLHTVRGPMVIEDLRALPTSPLIVAEGSVLPAWAVSTGLADRSRAVWLLPDAAFHEARLASGGLAAGPARMYRLLRQRAEQDAAVHGIAAVRVSASLTTSALVATVQQLFASALTAGPSARDRTQRRRLLREANLATVAQVRGYHARPWAAGDAETARQPFLCECADPACEADVWATIAQAAARPVLAADHR